MAIEDTEISYKCPKCGKRLYAPVHLVGRPVMCPHCEARMRVPRSHDEQPQLLAGKVSVCPDGSTTASPPPRPPKSASSDDRIPAGIASHADATDSGTPTWIWVFVSMGALVPVVLLLLLLLGDENKGPTPGEVETSTIAEDRSHSSETPELPDSKPADSPVDDGFDIAMATSEPTADSPSRESGVSRFEGGANDDSRKGEDRPTESAALTAPAPTWQTSFPLFAEKVRKAVSRGENLERVFSHKEIDWTVTFSSYKPKFGSLEFAESEQLRNGSPEIDVDAKLGLGAADEALGLAKGDAVTIRGKIGFVVVAHIGGRASVLPHLKMEFSAGWVSLT